MSKDVNTLSRESAEAPSSTGRRRLGLGLAIVAVAGGLAASWLWTSRQRLASEQSAVKSLEKLGAIVVLDGERRHAASVNLSPIQSSEALAKALERLPDLTRVTSLDASRTAISDDQLEFVAALPQLMSLSLSSTDVSDEGVRRLGSLTSLQSLYLASTAVADGSLPVIAQSPELRMLDLSATKVSANLEPLAQLPQLSWLALRQVSLSDEALPKLAQCKSLRRLSLEESKYSPDSLEALQKVRPQLSVDR